MKPDDEKEIPDAVLTVVPNHSPMTRCPHCNSWHRHLDKDTPGIYECEECGKKFKVNR